MAADSSMKMPLGDICEYLETMRPEEQKEFFLMTVEAFQRWAPIALERITNAPIDFEVLEVS